MVKRLEPIKDLPASLPTPLSQQTSEFAASLLSTWIEVRHCDERESYYKANPDIDPNSIRFKYKLTCKLEYEDDLIFKTQAALTANIMEETKTNLQEFMLRVMELENKRANIKLRNSFIEGLLELFSY